MDSRDQGGVHLLLILVYKGVLCVFEASCFVLPALHGGAPLSQHVSR